VACLWEGLTSGSGSWFFPRCPGDVMLSILLRYSLKKGVNRDSGLLPVLEIRYIQEARYSGIEISLTLIFQAFSQ
jgi:hypothetical protein